MEKWLDRLKGFAMILVIIGHGPVINERLRDIIWSFHMPLFFCIAGYTFHVIDNRGKFLKKKAKRLIVPYLITAVSILVINVIKSLYIPEISLTYTIGIIKRWGWALLYGSCWSYEKPFMIFDIGAIWFLLALFFTLLIYNEICLYVKDKMEMIVVICILSYVGIISKQFIWIPWSMQSAFVCLIFVYLGHRLHENNYLSNRSVLFMILMVVISLICIINKSYASVGNNDYTYGALTLIGASTTSLLLMNLFYSVRKSDCLLFRPLEFIGKNSLAYLCIHLLELDFIEWNSVLYAFRWNDIEGGYQNVLIIVLKILLISAFVVLIRRIPLLKNIF